MGWLVGKAEDGEAMAIERKLEAGQDDATHCHAYRRPKLLASTASDKAWRGRLRNNDAKRI